jgi:hypothetical protein
MMRAIVLSSAALATRTRSAASRLIEPAKTPSPAPVTGESFPSTKGAGDGVFAGSINREAALRVRVATPEQERRHQNDEEGEADDERHVPAREAVDEALRRASSSPARPASMSLL